MGLEAGSLAAFLEVFLEDFESRRVNGSYLLTSHDSTTSWSSFFTLLE